MSDVRQQRKGRLLVVGFVAMVAVAALFFMRTPSSGPQVTQHASRIAQSALRFERATLAGP
jgi:hypothetical protein